MTAANAWWDASDGRRKDRKAICANIEAIFAAATPHVWLEPKPDNYIASYCELTREYSDRTRRRAWRGYLVDQSLKEMYSRSAGGWMSRSQGRLKVNPAAAEEMANALNDFDGSIDACRRLIVVASQLANNSMVGGSKFLHFCFPELFAITDQYLRLVSNSPQPGDWQSQAAYYGTYMAALHLVDARYVEIALKWAENVFGYRVSPIRAVEAFVFYHVRAYDHGKLPWLGAVMSKAPRRTENEQSRANCSCRIGSRTLAATAHGT